MGFRPSVPKTVVGTTSTGKLGEIQQTPSCPKEPGSPSSVAAPQVILTHTDSARLTQLSETGPLVANLGVAATSHVYVAFQMLLLSAGDGDKTPSSGVLVSRLLVTGEPLICSVPVSTVGLRTCPVSSYRHRIAEHGAEGKRPTRDAFKTV